MLYNMSMQGQVDNSLSAINALIQSERDNVAAIQSNPQLHFMLKEAEDNLAVLEQTMDDAGQAILLSTVVTPMILH